MRIDFILYDESTVILETEGEGDEQASSSVAPGSDVPDVSEGADEHGAGDVSGVDDTSAASGDDDSSEIGQLVVDVTAEPRPLMSTPLDDYTVTEGLLMLLVIFAGLFGIISLFKGR